MSEKMIRCYAAAGGVVVDPVSGSVLILLVPGRVSLADACEARLPKGHIEPGESRPQAALREVLEETGLCGVEILADLGHQPVEFEYADRHIIRDESYFLMQVASHEGWAEPEPKFVRQWLPWEEAVARLTYEPEREWLRRARRSWMHSQR